MKDTKFDKTILMAMLLEEAKKAALMKSTQVPLYLYLDDEKAKYEAYMEKVKEAGGKITF